MSAAPWVTPVPQFFANDGTVLAGGKLYTYAAGGTTNQATYTDSGGGSSNTNPVVMDSAGRPVSGGIWLAAASYRFDLFTSAGVLVWSVDNVTGSALSTITTAAANKVYAGPTTGPSATPAFRSLVAADIPALTSTYADAALDNLASVNVNTSLLAQTGVDLGSTAKPFRHAYLWGSGTFGTTSIKLTGTPTGARVWTFPDTTDTVVGKATTDVLTNKTLTAPVIATIVNSGTLTLPTSTDTLVARTTTDFLKGKTFQLPVTTITADGAINSHTAAQYVITKAGVAGMTLGAPTATTDDGLIIIVTSNTANAHTITATGLFQTGAATVNVATFAAFAGASVTLMAYQGKWNVLNQNAITFT